MLLAAPPDGVGALSLLLHRLEHGGVIDQATLEQTLQVVGDEARFSLCAAMLSANFAAAAGHAATCLLLACLLRGRAEALGGASAPRALGDALAEAAAAAPRAAAAAVAAPLLLLPRGSECEDGAAAASRGALVVRALAAQASPAFGLSLLQLLCEAQASRAEAWGEAAVAVLTQLLLGEGRLTWVDLPLHDALPHLAPACEAAAPALAGSTRFGKLLHALAKVTAREASAGNAGSAAAAAVAALRAAAGATRTMLRAATLRLLDVQ
jgi:hypothetical protein